LLFPNKKPAIDWQSRVLLEIYCYRLENSTHDAKQTRAVMPNGHASLDRLRALLCCKRVCHFLTLLMKHHFRVIVKEISIPFLQAAVYLSPLNGAIRSRFAERVNPKI
jgi:hypothetical protein